MDNLKFTISDSNITFKHKYLRLKKLRANLKKNGRFPYLISNLTNIYYLTGFEGSYGSLLLDKDRTFFITDSRYTEYASSIFSDSIKIVQQKNDYVETLKEIFKSIKNKQLFVEQSMPLETFLNFKKKLRNIRISPDGDEVNQLRIVKDESEINIIRKAVALTDECFNHLLKIIKPGILEWEIAIEIDYFYRKNECRKSSFDSIVASGKGSSMPHYITSMSKKIDNNDILLIDMGCTYNGYNSDLTRTIFIGNIAPEFKRIYNIVRQAQEEAISRVKPGVTTGILDKSARDIISKENYGWAFGHSLGHGLGLEVHENPTLKNGNAYKLKKNIPFTIEPGIYIPDKGGVRIEDVVIVKDNGYEILTSSSKDIIII